MGAAVMNTTIDFPVVRIIADDPAPGVILLNAPRPLLGEPVKCDLMGFTVAAPTDDRMLEADLRLDAKHVVFILEREAIEETRQRLTAEYGADALADMSDDELIEMWRWHDVP